MPSLKAIKTRIASVKNTQKITRAMKLVAAAKMKRAVDAAVRSRPYSDEVTAVLTSLMARIGSSDHPLLQPRDEVKNAVEKKVFAQESGDMHKTKGDFFETTLQNANQVEEGQV